MMQLTTQLILRKDGKYIDASLYLVHFDSRNLAIVRGKRGANGRYSSSQLLGYYGNVKTALLKSIELAIKGGSKCDQLSELLEKIENLERHIEDVCHKENYPSMISLMRGES